MKKNFYLILFFLIAETAFPQSEGQAVIDSLLQELSKAKEDTHKADILNQLCWENIVMSNYTTALHYAEKNKWLSEKINYKKGLVNAYNNLGNIYSALGNYQIAYKNYFASLKLAEELENKIGIINAYNGIGNVYNYQDNYPGALKNFLICLKIQEEAGDKEGMAATYNNIGNVYLNSGNYKEALKNYADAVKINKKTGNKYWLATNYSNMANAYAHQGRYPEALQNCSLSLKLCEETGDKDQIALNYNDMGWIYYLQGNYSEALNNYLASLKITEETSNKILTALNYTSIGEAYIKLNRAEESKSWLQKALKEGKEMDSKSTLRDCYRGLAQSDSILGNYKGAYENYKLYIAYKDSLYNEENTRKLTQSEMQYEFEKKEAATKAEHEKKNIAQRNIRNASFIGFGGLLVFSVVVLRQRNKTKKAQQRAERSEQIKQQFLANMSHEIRTPMNAIIGMTNLVLETPLNVKQKNYLTGVKKSSENLLYIINDILDLSKIEAGKMELEQIDFSLRGLIEQVDQTLHYRAAEKGIELISTVSPDVPDVLIGDPVRLYQVLVNLAGNAVKFTEKGSVQINTTKFS